MPSALTHRRAPNFATRSVLYSLHSAPPPPGASSPEHVRQPFPALQICNALLSLPNRGGADGLPPHATAQNSCDPSSHSRFSAHFFIFNAALLFFHDVRVAALRYRSASRLCSAPCSASECNVLCAAASRVTTTPNQSCFTPVTALPRRRYASLTSAAHSAAPACRSVRLAFLPSRAFSRPNYSQLILEAGQCRDTR